MGEKIKALKTATTKELIAFWHTFKSGVWLKSPIFWARFMAYAIPLGFLLYVLYMNFLPFGYNKTFTIDVGSENDTKVSEFYLEPSKDLSERKTGTDANGKEYTYRELNGVAYAVFKPNAVLKDAEVTISVEGEGVSIIPLVIDFKPEDVKWDYGWDFTKEIPKDLTGNAFMFDGCAYFDGKSKLELPNSADKFENGPFTVYAEWTPQNSEGNFQQIVGHYNWELLQNKDSVSFQVGRMNDAEGEIYSVKYVPEDIFTFFNTKHTALAIYSPATTSSTNGHIDLFVDGNFSGRTKLGESNILWKGYGDKNLTFGKSGHGAGSYLKGCLSKVNYSTKNQTQMFQKVKFTPNSQKAIFTVTGIDSSLLNQIQIHVTY